MKAIMITGATSGRGNAKHFDGDLFADVIYISLND